ncbi:siroheme decarboxylase subunit alpha [Desulfosoma caldarium]|uniref:siroheme decarboxylase n=1 Tax=Desulfosoma caldarium TaxID=610254 RepID=A0A3N1UUB0_9BACT|nr:AsnC family transcriptional regulator [Desulfosoma caldarium]ROQ93308.1 AsnC family transcriptional regulator [Desulfosoma caldarium]
MPILKGDFLDTIDRRLLDQIQRSFPIEECPYAVLAERLGLREDEVIWRIESLKARRMVRQISAIFNTGALGYQSSLVAMAVPTSYVERAAEAVNAYPGVSHNYLRPAPFNLWFTIAVPPGKSLNEVVARLSHEAGGWPTLILPAVKKYKLAVVLDVLEDGETDLVSTELSEISLEGAQGFQVSERNIRLVRCLQEDLPLESRPFHSMAQHLNMGGDDLMALIRQWLARHWIRRFAAVLNHRQVGFGANGMVVWQCDPLRIDHAGTILAAFPEVSHCYQRPAHSQWPYNLYAMIHGKTEEECHQIAHRLAEAVDLGQYRILFSTREFKKIRLKLFWNEP